MQVLVLGSEGQLGSELCRTLEGHDLTPAAHDEVDIVQLTQLAKFAENVRPEFVINSAAYTDVNGCETNQDMAFLVNTIGSRNAALAAHKVGANLIHAKIGVRWPIERSYVTPKDARWPILSEAVNGFVCGGRER
jgi:dTDP-4-dehydrorhamnose reductase